MELKVEWAINPPRIKDIEDWNAVTLKHLSPKERDKFEYILGAAYSSSCNTVNSDTSVEYISVTSMCYVLVFDVDYFQYFLIHKTGDTIKAIRIADLKRIDLINMKDKLSNAISNVSSTHSITL